MREELFEKISSGNKLTTKEKLEAVKGLVSAKTEKILLQRIAQAILIKKQKVYFIIENCNYADDSDDIETFLGIMGYNNPKAEFFRSDDELNLRIQFNT